LYLQDTGSGYHYVPETNLGDLDYDEVMRIIDKYFLRWPFLKEAISFLGYSEIERLNYNHTNIKRVIEKKRLQSKSSRVANLLEVEGVTTNKYFTNTELKAILDRVYKMVDYYGSAKATDIEKYFNVRVREAKGVKGYLIRHKRTVFGQ